MHTNVTKMILSLDIFDSIIYNISKIVLSLAHNKFIT